MVRQLLQGRMRDVVPESMTPVVFGASNHVSLIVFAAMAGVVADIVVRDGAGYEVALLAAVLGAYGLLFGHRLWLPRTRNRAVSR